MTVETARGAARSASRIAGGAPRQLAPRPMDRATRMAWAQYEGRNRAAQQRYYEQCDSIDLRHQTVKRDAQPWYWRDIIEPHEEMYFARVR